MHKVILPMAQDGKQSIYAMGIDAPLAVLSDKPQLLYNFFKQNFAQVTNPPMDGLREAVVTSANVIVGNVANIMDPNEKGTTALAIDRPIITNEEMAVIKTMSNDKLRSAAISMLYPVNGGTDALETAIESLCIDALKAIKNGANLLVLTDRGVNSRMSAVPALLASSALHNYLIKQAVRPDVGIILESGEPREIHHFCTLIGYGISAVNPYIALETIKELIAKKQLNASYVTARDNYVKAAVAGILSVMSKMGISTVHSYHGAQIFEAVGIGRELIDKYFVNTPSHIGGIGIKEIAADNAKRHAAAYANDANLPKGDFYLQRKGGDTPHILNNDTVKLLRKACWEDDYDIYKQYAKDVNDSAMFRLRDLLEFVYPPSCSIPIEEVEPVDEIVKRFRTGAMSYGALSKEAHECIAAAMNRIGGMSNTGEGGEDSSRFVLLANGDDLSDKVKQVSTARFGVTSNYLVHSDVLQIKFAQGAKPGEGGRLPGNKLYPPIAKTRHSTTGVELISPPPHHDIYSIEDLAELVYDLKNANRKADISVKLCSCVGVGTIAAGVVKAKADSITICGYDGGTGAAARTSLRHAGLPWEIGLSEIQQTLLLNRLRDRVEIEVDSKMLTGRDVAIAALFGADAFAFCTGPMIAMGCIMDRVCNTNKCPWGICTQDENLRKKFCGKPEYVINFMRFVAQDLREIMAKLGFHTIDEMVGRCDRLKQKSSLTGTKADTVDLKALLYIPYTDTSVGTRYLQHQQHNLETTMDMSKLVRMCRPALVNKKHILSRLKIANTDRVTGTMLGSEISRRYGEAGLEEDTIKLAFVGSAGQSFGAFIPHGLTLELEGDANDSVGKGLSGGKISIYPPREAGFTASENIIIGNVGLFGATSGEAYISGIAGERFCVRNSGADVVVEGVGNHGCEYMTGGRVLVLGRVGRNFAAGMSGGIAYVMDLNKDCCNTQLVNLEKLTDPQEQAEVKQLLEKHVINTGSNLGKVFLHNWDTSLKHITKVIPKTYEEMQGYIKQAVAQGHTMEEAQIIAYNKKYAI